MSNQASAIPTLTPQVPPASTSVAMQIGPSRIFTLFPKLPPELRLKVWAYAANDDKNTVHHTYVVTIRMKNYPNRCTFKILSPIPALLHACADSRNEAMKNYVRCFKIGGGPDAEEIVYINPELTELFVKVPRRCCRNRRSLFRDFNRYGKVLGSPKPWGANKQRVSMYGIHYKEESRILIETLRERNVSENSVPSTYRRHLMSSSVIAKWAQWYETWEAILTSC